MELSWTGMLPLFFVASFASTIGGIILFFRQRWSQTALYGMISIGAGLLFSITMLHMLPHVAGKSGRQMMAVVVGFVFLFVVDLLAHGRGEGESGNQASGAVVGFVIHAFTEGISLAAGFQASPQLGMTLLVALLFHKIPEGLTMASLLLAETKRRGTAFFGSLILGVATLLGIFGAQLIERYTAPWSTDALLAFSTGVFLYVSTSHLVPYIRQSGKGNVGLLFLGAVLLYLLATVLFGGMGHMHE